MNQAADPTCAFGNIDGTNVECERCRLIAALTAAQQRVAELERDANSLGRDGLADVYDELIRLRKQTCVPMAMGKHTAANSKYCKQVIEELQSAGHHRAADWAIWMLWWRMLDWQTAAQVDAMRMEDNARLTADNDRLRALLRECDEALPSLGAAFNGKQWVEIPHPLKDRIKAAIGE